MGWSSYAKSAITRHVQGVENVYTQHKSHLAGVADSLMKGRLKESVYPFLEAGFRSSSARGEQKLPRAIIFVVGGATYEEARDITELNKMAEAGRSVVLGG